jgi:hypothetical protein
MLRKFKRIISLGNLKKASSFCRDNLNLYKFIPSFFTHFCKKAQIATLLILLIVIILILTLITINIGQVSIKNTNLSNAVDSAGLYLASQLATKSHMLWEALGYKTKKCKSGGFLSVVLSIAGAVIGFALGGPYGAAIGGTIGGAIGGAIDYGTSKGVVMGAILGLKIGASIAVGAKIGKAFGGWLFEGSDVAILAATVAGITLAAGANIYLGMVAMKNLEAAMAAYAKALSGLPEYERVREGIFFQVLSGVVDDPQKVEDTRDIDVDGDTTDLVSRFAYWWDEHLEIVRNSLDSKEDLIEDFLDNILYPFVVDSTSSSLIDQSILEFLPLLDRPSVECNCSSGEGRAIEVWDSLKSCGYDVDFWQPGPNKIQLINWYQRDCENCLPSPSFVHAFDDVDEIRMDLEDFVDYAMMLINRCIEVKIMDKDYTWLYLLYEPGDDDVYYAILDDVRDRLEGLASETEEIRSSLPGCQLVYNRGIEYSNNVKSVFPSCEEPPEYSCRDDEASIYPCNWVKESNNLDIYIPNPVCKVDNGDKEILYSEINTVKNYVNNLQEQIKQKFSGACNGSSPQDLEIEITSICLRGNLHNKCDGTDLGEGEATITYTYHYHYSCPVCEEICDDENNCETECNDVPYEGYNTESDNIGAPDLDIACLNKDSFLQVLNTFQENLNQMGDYFATTDEDLEDEFGLTISGLKKEADNISYFLQKLTEFYEAFFTNRAKNGAGEITYTWQDSLGEHSLTVETGPFKFARLKKKKKRFKVCVYLKDYCDNLEGHCLGDITWVKATRLDPANREVQTEK